MQGKLAQMGRRVHLQLRMYTKCSVPARLRHFLVPGEDPRCVDLSGQIFHMMRAIGGAWTEALHVDRDLASFASAWAEQVGTHSARVCPFCRLDAGTPRHVVMVCPEMAQFADAARDAVESEIQLIAPAADFIDAAELWWADEEARGRGHHRAAVSLEDTRRWPILCAWRWFVPMPEREAVYGRDEGGRSAGGTLREGANDLAYRCVMPRVLGKAICRLAVGAPRPSEAGEEAEVTDEEAEEEATFRQREALERGFSRRQQVAYNLRHVVKVTTSLALGLRFIRMEFCGSHFDLESSFRVKRVATGRAQWRRISTQCPPLGTRPEVRPAAAARHRSNMVGFGQRSSRCRPVALERPIERWAGRTDSQ